MENYRLEQTGQEVQDILNGAAMQTDLTAEVERAQEAEQALGGAIDDEELRAKAAEEALSGAIGDEELRAKAAEEQNANGIAAINAKIPAAASSENKLADKNFVNSSIETATATFRGSYNLVSDLHLAVDATHAQIATLLGTVIAEADNNDYSYVLVPTSAQTPTEIAAIEKYTYGANGWAFAYALNNSGFTSAQWAAINSGITSGLVAKLNALPTNADLLLLLAGKQDVLTFDDVPVEGSTNPVKSGGVHSAIDDEKTARVNAVNAVAGRVDTIEGEIPAQASSENQLADKNYVNSSISTATATFRGAFNLISDLGLTVSATHTQIGTALAGEISTADNNDYAFVQVPTSDETPAQILKVERYKFNGTAWVFEYELNNSGFTSAQWAALNSGITSGLVGKLNALPTNDELTLALAGKQDVLTFDNTPTENSNNPVKSGGVYAADKALSDAIEAILLLIPSAATSLNKLVDTDLMNSSISTATATFRGTFNLVSDLSLDLTATHAQIATALAGAIATADNNDYAFVQVPTAVGTPTEIASTDRYKFNGTAWAYEYTLNTSGFTSAQWAAINSGITAALVASLADIPDLIPSEATSANQLADKAYVLASILAATPAFKGQFTTLAELQAVASPKAGDLGIVRTKDSDGMDVFTVYQYLNNAWNVFYSLSYHPQTKPATTGTTGDYPYNGMGRVELAMNMVNTGTELAPVMVNQLTQDMFYKGAVGSRVPNTNTIFVIRYDYVLAENITIPDGCVLEFEGGSISGSYTLTGNYTQVNADDIAIFKNDIIIAGTWNVPTVYVDWFDLSETVGANNTPSIQNALALTDDNIQNTIVFPKKTLYVNEDINYHSTPQKLFTFRIKSNTDIILNSNIILNTNDVEGCTIFYMQEANNVSISGCGGITGDLYTHTGTGQGYGHGISIRGSKNITIKDIYINKCWGDGIDADSYYPYDPRQYYDPEYPGYINDPTKYPASNDDFTHHSLYILIDNVKLDNNRRNGISLEGAAYAEVKNCVISNTGQFLSGNDSVGGIDVEPWVRNEGNRGINIHDNSFYNNYYRDIVLNCVGGDGTGWGSYITIHNNYNKIVGHIITAINYLDNLNISDCNILNGAFYKIHDIVFSNCTIKEFGRNEGVDSDGLVANNYNIYFKNCKFIKPADDSTPFIKRVSATRGLKADFINCRFETGSQCQIIESAAYSEISLYDCIVNAVANFRIGGVKNMINCTITCSEIDLSFNQVSGDYVIKGNKIKSTSVSDYTLIRIDGQETLPSTLSIFVENNYVDKALSAMKFIDYDDASSAPRFAAPNIYIIGNKCLNNPRFGEFNPTNVKKYANVSLGGVDSDPYTGETAYPDGAVPKVYDGTNWVDIVS